MDETAEADEKILEDESTDAPAEKERSGKEGVSMKEMILVTIDTKEILIDLTDMVRPVHPFRSYLFSPLTFASLCSLSRRRRAAQPTRTWQRRCTLSSGWRSRRSRPCRLRTLQSGVEPRP